MVSPGNLSATEQITARQVLMRACAQATQAELEAALAALGYVPEAEEIRPPQTGLVMVRGRIGGSGPAFNLGEATMTRTAVRLATGAMGFSYLLGRSHSRARLAAVIDALGQDPRYRTELDALLVAPVMARWEAERAERRAETAATRVDFLTVVRGED